MAKGPTVGATVLLSAAAVLSGQAQLPDNGQIQHARGRNVVPVYEGWFEDSDGDIQVAFGYLNRNYEETIDIPVGPDNRIQPGPSDQGQPTHFPPRREKGVFTVRMPDPAPETEISWTLTHRGQTYTVPANLDPLFNIDALRQRGGEFDGNTPPVLTFPASGASSQGPAGASLILTTPVARPLPLDVDVRDDGLPPPEDHDVFYSRFEQRTAVAVRPPRAPRGLKVLWSKYRGPGAVTFDAAEVSVTEGRAHATATFDRPGEYILRAKAVEGPRPFGFCCWTNGYVRVTVTP
ncbi:MAG: hypothetical protein OXF27_21040 [Acidobacteria bacterium]|nr:hypothetical protein [Acidobacteriota bacterium]